MTTSNLFNGEIKNEDFVNLADVTGITFSSGTKYCVQVQSGKCYFCEKASDPVGGFLIGYEDRPFTIEYGNPIFVKKYKSCEPCIINISGEDA